MGKKHMSIKFASSNRFKQENCYRIHVQIPQSRYAVFAQHMRSITPLIYGDYDSVIFKTVLGEQSFRSSGNGRNCATENAVCVPCVEASFFVEGDARHLSTVVEAIYDIHPYEEPVIYVAAVTRTLHVRYMDEDNPNRFWNNASEDWVPKKHRDQT